jgi:hypothetical protein
VLTSADPDGLYSWEDPRVHRVRSGTAEHYVMTYTNLPPPDANEFWRIGVHRLDYADGGFSLEQGSGQVIGPPGEPDKDGIVFNLRDGRVALIHRIYPNMQLAVFDSLEQLWDPRRVLGGHWPTSSGHDHPAARHVARRRCRHAAHRNRRRAGALYRERDGRERLQHQDCASRPRHRRGRVATAEPASPGRL